MFTYAYTYIRINALQFAAILTCYCLSSSLPCDASIKRGLSIMCVCLSCHVRTFCQNR